MSLITSLHFPRALLPVATVLAELFTLLPALLVLVVLVLLVGRAAAVVLAAVRRRPSLLMGVLHRHGVHRRPPGRGVRDLAQLVPFVLRVLMYVSGVFFSIDHYVGSAGRLRRC